jgi:hypothetical protein
VQFPVLVQPGQEAQTISVALGYGRTEAGVSGSGTGTNAYTLLHKSGARKNYITNATVEKISGKYDLALTQTHHSMEGRAIIRETTLKGIHKRCCGWQSYARSH